MHAILAHHVMFLNMEYCIISITNALVKTKKVDPSFFLDSIHVLCLWENTSRYHMILGLLYSCLSLEENKNDTPGLCSVLHSILRRNTLRMVHCYNYPMHLCPGGNKLNFSTWSHMVGKCVEECWAMNSSLMWHFQSPIIATQN